MPFILVDPRREGSRVDRSHLVSTGLDVVPTLCDYAGAPIPERLKGRSLRPLVEGTAEHWRDHLVVETEFGLHSHPFGIAGRAVVSDRHKYMVYSKGEHREMFIDLQSDPGELTNLIDSPDHTEAIQHHRELLKQWQTETGDVFR